MRNLLALLALSTTLLAQTPNLSGVWKADLTKSKFAGPPPTGYLAIIEQKGPEFTETSAQTGPRGEQRAKLAINTSKPDVVYYQGLPTRFATTSEENTFNIAGEVPGRPMTLKRKYQLSSDGQTLTLDTLTSANGKDQQTTIVLLKQPDAAGDPLRKPEETAEVHYKNVKTDLKTLPASEFINNMRYFTYALGKDCEFCHVQRKFDSDDKKEKVTARKMIAMNIAINQQNFDGKMEVRCFTCHEMHNKPLSRPQFPGEAEKASDSTK